MRTGRLAGYTTFGIGGEGEIFLLERVEQAAEALAAPHIVLGRGSNVLISDRGLSVRAVINRLGSVVFDGDRVYAESGAALSGLSAACVERGLSGLEWACGIPGSVGGAAVMNAGAFGGCMADLVTRVDVLRGGKVLSLPPEECGFCYRGSGFTDGDFVLGAELKLRKQTRERVAELTRECALRRAASQPKGRSAGSVYKRAERPAGYYIERAGLKGAREGGAFVSEKHANFIINGGGATARDVLALMERIEDEVRRTSGVELQREIRFLGEP